MKERPPSHQAESAPDGDVVPRDILVVDDDPANLTAIEVALGELGRRLIEARSGRDALRLLLDRDVSLILLDVQMPGMDGFETARLIRSRARSRHVPIIFLTAYSRDDHDVLRGYELGAVDFLFKPIVPEVLRAKASVFVALQERADEVRRQAAQLRMLERREIDRRMQDERRRWEAEQLREEARRKDEFLAILAHELRNPLASIVTGLELMRTRFDGADDESVEAHGSMHRQVCHLVRLVDDLLDVSRISQGKIALERSRVDLREVIEQAIDATARAARPLERRVEVVLPDEPVYLMGDHDRLVQVASNLLNNAIRYTPAAGRIRLELAIEVDGNARLSVEDEGRGIELEMLDQIFEIFTQAHEEGDGLGLGLTLVHQLVELHEGTVTAHSDGPGLGSTFTVRLPTCPRSEDGIEEGVTEEPPADPVEAEPAEAEATLRVAVVDDEDDVRRLLGVLLRRWGHHVELAADGADGIELVLRERPDVVLMDVGMPGVDGYEAARRIRDALDEECPRLIAMTGYGSQQHRARTRAAGFDAHIVKPAYPEDLRQLLRGEDHGREH